MNTPTMKQLSFASAEYAGKNRMTRREKFLGEMAQVVPWAALEAVIEPHYPKSGRVGRPPIGVPLMLRMYFLQQWFGLSDDALEDAVYDSCAMREFLGIDLSMQDVPEATTVLKFRRLLETHGLTAQIFEAINAHLSERGLLLKEGTLIDATIIAAALSTKNQARQRDLEMHQTKKGNQWYFGMKGHIGADAASGLVHSVHVTAANESDVAHAHELLHGQEKDVFADGGYAGVDQREEVKAAQEAGAIGEDLNWHVAAKRSQIKAMPEGALKTLTKALEKTKAQIRARIEHLFHVVKNIFGHKKARYKGLARNAAQLMVLFGLANLVRAKASLMAMQGVGAP
jgi:IS5 family transposase